MEYGIYQNGAVLVKFVAPMSVISNNPVFGMDAVSLKRYTSSQNAQRWEIQTNLMPENGTADFMVHSVMNGYQNVFDILMPQAHRLVERNTKTRNINASGTKGNTYVNVDAVGGEIPKGTFVKFSNHDKIYMLTESLTSGSGTMRIYPALQRDLSVVVVHHKAQDVIMKARYDNSSSLGITFQDGWLSDPGSVKFIEHF